LLVPISRDIVLPLTHGRLLADKQLPRWRDARLGLITAALGGSE